MLVTVRKRSLKLVGLVIADRCYKVLVKKWEVTVWWWFQQEHPVRTVDFGVGENQYKLVFCLVWEREAEILQTSLYLHEASITEELPIS